MDLEQLNIALSSGCSDKIIHAIEVLNRIADTSLASRNLLGESSTATIVCSLFASPEYNRSAQLIIKLLHLVCSLCGYNSLNQESEFSEVNISKFGDLGISGLLISCLQKHLRNDDVIISVSRCIRILSFGNISNRLIFCDHGANEILTSVLASSSVEMEDVIREGCWALMSLAYDDESANRQGNSGMCEIVAELLQKYPILLSERTMVAMCWLVRNLSASNYKNCFRFKVLNIDDSLIPVLNHEVCKVVEGEEGRSVAGDVMFAAVGAVASLCYHEEFATQFISKYYYDTLIDVVKKCLDDSNIMEMCCEGIRNLSVLISPKHDGGKPVVEEQLLSYQGDDLLVEILKVHCAVENVVVMASRAIGNLSLGKGHFKHLLGNGSVQCIEKILYRLVQRAGSCDCNPRLSDALHETYSLLTATTNASLPIAPSAVVIEDETTRVRLPGSTSDEFRLPPLVSPVPASSNRTNRHFLV